MILFFVKRVILLWVRVDFILLRGSYYSGQGVDFVLVRGNFILGKGLILFWTMG